MQQKRFLSLMACLLCAGMLAGCAGGTTPPADATKAPGDAATQAPTTDAPAGDAQPQSAAPVDTSQEANLIYYMFGSEGVANPDVVAAINQKLKADINATIEVKYIDWPDVSTKYPLLFASGESFDMAHASPSAAISMYTLASQDALKDITGMIDTVTPALRAEIPDRDWAIAKYNGKIIGVPNMFTEYTPYGFVYRRDLQEKYGLAPITSIDGMTAYMDKVKENESFPPMNGNANLANDLYRMLIALTGKWIEAPGIPSGTNNLVCVDPADYKNIIHPAFTQEFEDWCVRMNEWSAKEYWPKDVLSAQANAKDNTHNNLSGAYITHMPDWTGSYGTIEQKMPGVVTDFWCFEESTGKIVGKKENCTVISTNSKYPERALMAIEKFMTDESYYRLMQYGIEGRQYQVENGLVVRPAGFDETKDGFGFAAWSLRNDRFNIPQKSEDPRRYELIEKWRATAIPSPYTGFSFDSTPVTSELANVANVNANLGIQLLVGRTQSDPKTAVTQYRDQLKKAGVDKIIAEIQKQLEGFTPIQ